MNVGQQSSQSAGQKAKNQASKTIEQPAFTSGASWNLQDITYFRDPSGSCSKKHLRVSEVRFQHVTPAIQACSGCFACCGQGIVECDLECRGLVLRFGRDRLLMPQGFGFEVGASVAGATQPGRPRRFVAIVTEGSTLLRMLHCTSCIPPWFSKWALTARCSLTF